MPEPTQPARDAVPVPSSEAGAATFQSPPQRRSAKPEEVAGLERRARRLGWISEPMTGKATPLAQFAEWALGALITFVLCTVVFGLGGYGVWLLAAVVAGGLLLVGLLAPLHARYGRRVRLRSLKANQAARLARDELSRTPQDEYRTDTAPDGASPTPALPRDGFSSDAPATAAHDSQDPR